jgi:hypothetical protein
MKKIRRGKTKKIRRGKTRKIQVDPVKKKKFQVEDSECSVRSGPNLGLWKITSQDGIQSLKIYLNHQAALTRNQWVIHL